MWFSLYSREPFGPAPDSRQVLADLDTRDAAEILAEGWPATSCPCCLDRLDPFRDGFPGLLPRPAVDPEDARWHAARVATDHPRPGEPDMVAATRPADVPALIDWRGPCNAWDDMVALSAVLRSWEERFGALAYRINGATLHLRRAAPSVRGVRGADRRRRRHGALVGLTPRRHTTATGVLLGTITGPAAPQIARAIVCGCTHGRMRPSGRRAGDRVGAGSCRWQLLGCPVGVITAGCIRNRQWPARRSGADGRWTTSANDHPLRRRAGRTRPRHRVIGGSGVGATDLSR